MNSLRGICVVAVIVGLAACGGAPQDAPANVDAAGQTQEPTAVFSDDFETGEAEDWQPVDDAEEAEVDEGVDQPE